MSKKKEGIYPNVQHIRHCYEVNPEMVNNHYGMTSNKKTLQRKKEQRGIQKMFVQS